MSNLFGEFDDDSSIVLVSASLCQNEMELDNRFVFSVVPEIAESLMTDSTVKQCQDILKENKELKDALAKNNRDMRLLLVSFQDLQDKTLQAHAIHKQKIDSMWKDNQQLHLQMDNISKQCHELQEKVEEKEIELEKFKDQLSAAEILNKNSENATHLLRKDQQEKETQLLELNDKVESLTSQNQALMEKLGVESALVKEQLSAAEIRNKTSENTIQLLRKDQREKETQLLELNDKVESLTAQNQAFMEKLYVESTLLSAAEIRNKTSESTIQLLKEDHQEKQTQLLELNCKVESLAAENQELKKEQDAKSALLSQLEGYRQDFEKECDEKAKAEASVDLFKQEIHALQLQVSELLEELKLFHDQQQQQLNLHQEHQQNQELTRDKRNNEEQARADGDNQSEENNQEPARTEESNEDPARAEGSTQNPQNAEEAQRTLPEPIEVFVMPQSSKVTVEPYRPPDSEKSRRHRRSYQ